MAKKSKKSEDQVEVMAENPQPESKQEEKKSQNWNGPGNLIDRGRIIKPGDPLPLE